MCFYVCCAFERTSTEATISNVTGQSSPHHGKECGELGDQHKHIPFWVGFVEENLLANEVSLMFDHWIRWKPGWQKLKIRCWLPFERPHISRVAVRQCLWRLTEIGTWRYYQSLFGWRLEHVLNILDIHELMVVMLWFLHFTSTRYCTSGNNYEAWSPFGHVHQFASFCCGNVGHQNWCWELRRNAKNGLGLHLGISKTAPWILRIRRCLGMFLPFCHLTAEVLLQPGQVCLNSSQARMKSLPWRSWDRHWMRKNFSSYTL